MCSIYDFFTYYVHDMLASLCLGGVGNIFMQLQIIPVPLVL